MSAKSETPRTDTLEEKMYFEGMERTFRTEYLFSNIRDVERELAAVKVNRDYWMKSCKEAQEHRDGANAQLAEFERELAATTIDRDNYEAKYLAMRERAEKAEEIAKLKGHAASLRKYIETDAFECPTAVADYDRDYPEES